MYETYEECLAELYRHVEHEYDEFNNKIVNSDYRTVGVRTPIVKKLAKSVPLDRRDDILGAFMSDADRTYESVLFAGCLAARKGDFDKTVYWLKRIVPLFGSWAHVDCVTPLLDWADCDRLLGEFAFLKDSARQYEKRFFIMIMFSCCLGDSRVDHILETLRRDIVYGEYYVDMAAAWLLAECLVKYYDKTIPLFIEQTFSTFVHNKAIQKARESFRVPAQIKEYLNTLKVKNKR